MTGHGSATVQDQQVQLLVEIRTVNNRFLKVTVSGDLDAAMQSKVEGMIRDHVQRGAVNIRVQFQFLGENSQYQINMPQLQSYRKQLTGFSEQIQSGILGLPGVALESMDETSSESAWPQIESAVKQALDKLVDMRRSEGQAMLKDLLANCEILKDHVAHIKKLAPNVVDDYSKRITERINRMLEEHKVTVSTSDLIKEIGVFAERVDTSEELVRLDSHLEQFGLIAATDDSNGRKLDFLTQELLRETNTIGSKANDAKIANHVVEMKTIIERIREMIQNIE
jgi:uncharacterized protein (TIGR00255 family)